LHATIGTNFSGYLKNLTTPYSILRQLKKVAKPSQATLQQMVLDDLKKRKQGPKRQTLESWLQLHITIIQNGEELEEGLIEVTESSVVRAFVQDCEEVCPALYHAFIQKVAKREKLEMATMIEEFNLLYKHPNTGRNAHATLSGQPSADPTTSTTPAPSQSSEAKCFACGLPHKLKNCKQLFQSLRGSNFVPNDECLRRCQEWLKVPTNKQYYDKRVKQIEREGPRSRTSTSASSTAEKIEDLDRPRATAAAVTTSFSSSTSSQDYPDLSLINAWGYDTMADTHFCNDIRYFRDFKPSMSIATAGDSGAEIHGYGDINLAIEVGKQRLTRYLTLRNVAYAPYFYTNLISTVKLRRVGVIIN
jgi:hypothetical protein